MLTLIALFACSTNLPVNADDTVARDPEHNTVEVVITDDTADVDTDTGEDADIEEINCTFEVVTPGNGRATIGNELQFTLSASSPSGESFPGYREVLRLNITSLHPECADVELDYLRFGIAASDNEGTGWLSRAADGSDTGRNADVYDLSTDGTEDVKMTAEVITYDNGEAFVAPWGSLRITAGTTHIIAVYIDTTGASTFSDDAIRFEVSDLLHVTGIESSVYAGDEVTGGTLVY